jgi:hypothetical protein
MQYKLITLLLFAAIAVNSYATDTTQLKQFNRVYVGVSFTPSVSYRFLSQNKPSTDIIEGIGSNKYIIDFRNKREVPSFCFSIGAKVGVRFTSFLSLETGVNYTRQGYQQKVKNLQFGSQWNGNGYDSVDNGYEIKLYDVYHYINIPLGLNFNFGKGKINAVINTGVNFDFIAGKQTKSVSNIPGFTNRTTTDRSPFTRFNLSPFLGIGFDYQITRLISLRVMPTAQIQALKNIDTPITEHLWSAGINTCLLFGFKKVSLK